MSRGAGISFRRGMFYLPRAEKTAPRRRGAEGSERRGGGLVGVLTECSVGKGAMLRSKTTFQLAVEQMIVELKRPGRVCVWTPGEGGG